VHTHIHNLLQKLGARSRLQGVTLALQQRLIPPPD
jgi:DNA-binding NarL/FixJ family response regulator